MSPGIERSGSQRRSRKGPLRQVELQADRNETIGYIRDALIILGIALGGLYVLSHPEIIDAFLNWMLERD